MMIKLLQKVYRLLKGISSNSKKDPLNQSIDDIYQSSNLYFDNTSTKSIFAINNINFHDDNDKVTSLNKKRKRENSCNQNVDEKKGNDYEDKVKKKEVIFLIIKIQKQLKQKKKIFKIQKIIFKIQNYVKKKSNKCKEDTRNRLNVIFENKLIKFQNEEILSLGEEDNDKINSILSNDKGPYYKSESSEPKIDQYGYPSFSNDNDKIIHENKILNNDCMDDRFESSEQERDKNSRNSLNEKESPFVVNNIIDKINLNKLQVFNKDNYKQNYEKYKEIKFKEPKFISLKEIIKNDDVKENLSKLWNFEINIYDDESDFTNSMKNGDIIKNVILFLKHNIKQINKFRKFDPDQMINKIKRSLNESIRQYINSFLEIKYKVCKLKKQLINEASDAHFNLMYLNQPLYSILINDSNDINKLSNYDKIKFIYKDNKDLIDNLELTIQDYLDIFRYKKTNVKFQFKLVDFLTKLSREIKFNDINEKKEIIKKDYVSSVLLLTYNYERFFYLRLKNDFKIAEKKI